MSAPTGTRDAEELVVETVDGKERPIPGTLTSAVLGRVDIAQNFHAVELNPGETRPQATQ